MLNPHIVVLLLVDVNVYVDVDVYVDVYVDAVVIVVDSQFTLSLSFYCIQR